MQDYTGKKNRQFQLAQRPVGIPGDECWTLIEGEVPAIDEGELLIRVLMLSLDPAMRGWMNDVRSYIPPVQIGEVMRALGVGEVVASKHSDFQVGDVVTGSHGVQEYAVSDGKMLHKVDLSLAPCQTYLGVLGMPGMTAYFGLLEVGLPKEGETVVVSGASGAVGAVVGQIAKLKGCRVVGIAGGAEKCAYLRDELGFDAAIDYKNEDLTLALKKHCPKRIDVYFDNVGGKVLDAVLERIAAKARIVICGAISQYNNEGAVTGPSNYLALLVARARMEGFVVFDYAQKYGQAAREMGGWIAEGKLKTKEHVVDGLEKFPQTLRMLFAGDNFGKLVLKVADQ